MKADKGYSYIGIIILFGLIMWHLTGCMSDRTALQKVLTKEPLFDTVGQVYTNLHPCDNKVIAHHTDTFYTEEEIPYYLIDSIPCNGKAIHDTIKGKIKYIDTGYHSIDTIIDNQQLSLCKSQIEDKSKQIATLNGVITTQQLQVSKEHSRGNEWCLYFWLLLAAIVIALVLYIVKPRL